jgi:hypothetical protein
MMKRLKPAKVVKPEQLADLTPEERRQAVEGVSKEEFFRRLRTIPEWRKERLARFGQNSR